MQPIFVFFYLPKILEFIKNEKMVINALGDSGVHTCWLADSCFLIKQEECFCFRIGNLHGGQIKTSAGPVEGLVVKRG